jgi:dTMP kinase
MTDVLRHSGFRRLLFGQGISALGDWMVTVAMMALVLELSGSSAAVGAILILRLLPAILAGPLAARAVTRWDRRTTMVSMDLVRAGMVIVLPAVRALWWVYGWAFMLEVAGLIFVPARDASIPELVEESQLPAANGLVLASSYGTIPLGAGAFAAVAALAPHAGFIGGHPYALVFWVDALTFLASFVFIRRLELGGGRSAGGGPDGEPSRRFRDAFALPVVSHVLVPTATISLGIGTLFSLGVVYVRNVLGASDTQFGTLTACFGLGAAAGLVILHLTRGSDPVAQVRTGVAAQGAVIAVMSGARSLGLAFAGAIGFGAATAFTLASGMSVLQEELDGEERVLAFTAFHVVIRAGLGLSALCAGLAADLVRGVHLPWVGTLEPVRLVLVCAGLVVLASAALVRHLPGLEPRPSPRRTSRAGLDLH